MQSLPLSTRRVRFPRRPHPSFPFDRSQHWAVRPAAVPSRIEKRSSSSVPVLSYRVKRPAFEVYIGFTALDLTRDTTCGGY
jgi:hypothetical protein